jgi:hypothetical protein
MEQKLDYVSLPKSKVPAVKKFVPEWIARRDKMLRAVNCPSDESAIDYSTLGVDEESNTVENVSAADGDKLNTSDEATTPISLKSLRSEETDNSDSEIRTKTLSQSLGSDSDSSFSRSIHMNSTDGSSGWSTPDEAEITTTSSSRLNSDSDPPSDGRDYTEGMSSLISAESNLSDNSLKSDSNRTDGLQSLEIISESNREVGEHSPDITPELISESNRTEGQHSSELWQSYRSVSKSWESYRTADTFASLKGDPSNPSSSTNTRPETAEAPASPEAPPRESDEESGDGDDSRANSVASFWGNPVRFDNPNREKEAETDDSTQDVITKEEDPDHRLQPMNWIHRWMTPARSVDEYDYDYSDDVIGQPDPPAAMDSSLFLDADAACQRSINKSSSRNGNPWMPPAYATEDTTTVDEEESTKNKAESSAYESMPVVSSAYESLSAVTSTIAETLQRLREQERQQDKTETSTTADTMIPGDSSAASSKSSSRRLDFAGQTTTGGDGGSVCSRDSASLKIRKYYKQGKTANERLRRLYMPTAIPVINELDEEEEGLFDWVPPQYKHEEDDVEGRNVYMGVNFGDSFDDDDENYDIDIEASRQTSRQTSRDATLEASHDSTISSAKDGTTDPGSSSLFDEIEISNSGSDDGSHSSSKRQLAAEDDESERKAFGGRDVEQSVATGLDSEHDMNLQEKKMCCIRPWGIGLIIVLIPGIALGVVFGLRWWKSRSS